MTTRLPAFDVLVDMARNDPQGLETLRRSLTEAVIEAASTEHKRKRLQGLQFRIDMERKRAKNQLAATIRISEMMCRSLADLHRSIVAPFGKFSDGKQADDAISHNATVLGFPDGFPRVMPEDFQPF